MNTTAPYFASQSVSLGSLALAMAGALALAVSVLAQPDSAYQAFVAPVQAELSVVFALANANTNGELEHDELSPLSCCSHSKTAN